MLRALPADHGRDGGSGTDTRFASLSGQRQGWCVGRDRAPPAVSGPSARPGASRPPVTTTFAPAPPGARGPAPELPRG